MYDFLSDSLKYMFRTAHRITAKTGLVSPPEQMVTIGGTVVPLETAVMFMKYGHANGMSPLVHSREDVLSAIRNVVGDEQKVQEMITPVGRRVPGTQIRLPQEP